MKRKGEAYTYEEMMEFIVKSPEGRNLFSVENDELIRVKDIVAREEKKLRIARLNSDASKIKKLAFKGEKLDKLKQDRQDGMSIRALANKYDCSTRTIQKYLKDM